jgi:hypothetical protein
MSTAMTPASFNLEYVRKGAEPPDGGATVAGVDRRDPARATPVDTGDHRERRVGLLVC